MKGTSESHRLGFTIFVKSVPQPPNTKRIYFIRESQTPQSEFSFFSSIRRVAVGPKLAGVIP